MKCVWSPKSISLHRLLFNARPMEHVRHDHGCGASHTNTPEMRMRSVATHPRCACADAHAVGAPSTTSKLSDPLSPANFLAACSCDHAAARRVFSSKRHLDRIHPKTALTCFGSAWETIVSNSQRKKRKPCAINPRESALPLKLVRTTARCCGWIRVGAGGRGAGGAGTTPSASKQARKG